MKINFTTIVDLATLKIQREEGRKPNELGLASSVRGLQHDRIGATDLVRQCIVACGTRTEPVRRIAKGRVEVSDQIPWHSESENQPQEPRMDDQQRGEEARREEVSKASDEGRKYPGMTPGDEALMAERQSEYARERELGGHRDVMAGITKEGRDQIIKALTGRDFDSDKWEEVVNRMVDSGQPFGDAELAMRRFVSDPNAREDFLASDAGTIAEFVQETDYYWHSGNEILDPLRDLPNFDEEPEFDPLEMHDPHVGEDPPDGSKA